ncbi:hypothetical protein LXA43DRAFT_1014349 [Ganoderma leucocontextum]|nr:hypothetical protein LXA43DRAFT_1014349 [Ganoderma leucocontextum]
MIQSTLVISGFFQLWNGSRVPSPRRTDSSALTYHCEYDTALQCVDNSALPVKFRIFSPPGDVTFPDRTVSFIHAKAYFPADRKPVLLEGTRQAMLPGNPDDENYQTHAPNLTYSLIHGVGVVQATTQDAGPQDSREFKVEVRPWVRDDNQPCTVTCVMPGNAARWRKVPLPFPNTIVYFAGMCGRVRDNGMLEVALDDMLFNIAAPPPPPSPTITRPTAPLPTKRQKFDASSYVPHRSIQTATSSSVPTASSSTAHTDAPSPLAHETQPSSSQNTTDSSMTARSPSPPHVADHSQGHIYSTRAAEKRKLV